MPSIWPAGLRPLSELATLAGCRMIAAPDLGGTVPLYGHTLETTAPGVSVAGNIAGIESATVAMAQGRLAAIAIVDPPRIGDYQHQLAQARRDAPICFLPKRGEAAKRLPAHGRKRGAMALMPAPHPLRGRNRRVIPLLDSIRTWSCAGVKGSRSAWCAG